MFPLVQASQVAEWEAYAVKYQSWLAKDITYTHPEVTLETLTTNMYSFPSSDSASYVSPLWQLAPTPTDWSLITKDYSSKPELRGMMDAVIKAREVRVSGDVTDEDLLALYSVAKDAEGEVQPKTFSVQAIYEDITDDAPVVGFLLSMFSWDKLMTNVLSNATKPMLAVIQGEVGCDVEFTYSIEGPTARFLDYGNLGDAKYAKRGLTHRHALLNRSADIVDDNSCAYYITIYPTADFESFYHTSQPIIYTCIILACFLVSDSSFIRSAVLNVGPVSHPILVFRSASCACSFSTTS